MNRTVPSLRPGCLLAPLTETADCGDRSSLERSSRGLVRDLDPSLGVASLESRTPLAALMPLVKGSLLEFCVWRGYLLAEAS